ncbi:mycothiol system anti-sigma-R factor [Streptomyces sp. PTM05]|uniref:Mycothiol system anti-sigma-R factor n=1 Tax=Streptantibioticus parmotrematis TaxID=2873249 RepID=A0ABS7QYD9_9ACTN|nr:mycothiol system anti-sigma-R factor [Streptantibioticus parmotrematis]MBY8888231.1 mycothiol system anti-sigma-R factor [Streptantibioticus parmotrematis]
MSCGDPHETDCSEVLDHLYEYLDHEMSEGETTKFEEHFGECNPCLEKYGLEQAVKKLVKRCCGHDDVPGDLRSKVLGRIEMIRAGEIRPEAEASRDRDRDEASGGPAKPSEPAAKAAKGSEPAKASKAGSEPA